MKVHVYKNNKAQWEMAIDPPSFLNNRDERSRTSENANTWI